MGGAITMNITSGMKDPGGTSIIRSGPERITQNGLATAILMTTIVGMTAFGGENTMKDGHTSIIPIGFSAYRTVAISRVYRKC